MDRRRFFALASGLAAVASTTGASARFMGGAVLDHAVPGVGLTVNRPVLELRLYFDLDVLASVSSVRVETATGAAIPTSAPANEPTDRQVVIVRFGHSLPPGTYSVAWSVVSINRRTTSGTFHFTVS